MKIVYKQANNDLNSSLTRFSVEKCFFKQLSFNQDVDIITKKRHHHTDFELHIVTNGFREYVVNNKKFKINKNNFLLIFPKTPHISVSSSPDFQGVSITFSKSVNINKDVFHGKLTKRMLDNVLFISDEGLVKKEISSILIENSILEILVFTFRLLGLKENKSNVNQDENHIISMAKQYIEDNIDANPSVSDISKYCHLGIKQLTRIFTRYENTSPGKYIISRRIARIETFLTKQTISIKDISDIMNFNNEYYFNSFFKKYSGMPPGEYRKMFCANTLKENGKSKGM